MRFEHPDLPGRGVRLAYCLNLHAADDLAGVLAGMRAVTVPLADRLAPERTADAPFGVGVWLPADVALALAAPAGATDLARYVDFFREHRLDPFTFNAFPYGGFHTKGLKERVFRPTWKAPERSAYTLGVARIAHALHGERPTSHVSISTHAGMFGEWVQGQDDLDACADAMLLVGLALAQLEDESGLRIVLSLEPEPRSSANDTGVLSGFHERLRARALHVLGRDFPGLRELSERVVQRHLGTCLDTCHAAVEFEEPATAFANATLAGTPLGKLQFSSALALARPGHDAPGRQALFALAEPTYLHQVTARAADQALLRVRDLPDAEARFQAADPAWQTAQELRCHFHVPVDLTNAAGLATTRAAADATLAEALANPARWGTTELHVEIETYTWDVLPDHLKTGDIVDYVCRELEWVRGQLQ